MKTAVLAGALLCSFAAMAAGDDDECTTDIVSVAERAVIRARAARLFGSGNNIPAGARAFSAEVPKLWTCSKDSKTHCCKKIPVDVWVDTAACFVTLPYGKLAVSTDGGTKMPTIVWELRVEKSADQLFKYKFAFDKVAGIKLLKLPGTPLPAKDGDHEGGSDSKFKLDSTGVVGAESGHWPRVYPKKADGSLDLANECTPWDPTITNTN